MLFRYKPDIFTDIPGIKHHFPHASPVVLKLCRMAGIAGAVDRMVRWNESNSRTSPGLVIESSLLAGRHYNRQTIIVK